MFIFLQQSAFLTLQKNLEMVIFKNLLYKHFSARELFANLEASAQNYNGFNKFRTLDRKVIIQE